MPQKLPRPLFPDSSIFVFPPNRETLGGTAYLVQAPEGNLLIDSPAWSDETSTWLAAHGGVRWIALTHRNGIAKVRNIQAALHCEILIQEQEAYLLPNLTVTSFHQFHRITPDLEILWTSGHTPGSSCIHTSAHNGILFTGRHLLPDRNGNPAPLRIAKTFHWKRQLKNIQALRDRYSAQSLDLICPGASTGYLRGANAIGDAYTKLEGIDLAQLQNAEPGL
jgi:glyoxylase-like metal-dependent hydrolase (beta-lactamase superfamily II)